jgi:hypothetical protein
MKKLLIIVLYTLFGAVVSYAQGEIDEQQRVFFRNERSGAILLNSDGFGLNYREAKGLTISTRVFLRSERDT